MASVDRLCNGSQIGSRAALNMRWWMVSAQMTQRLDQGSPREPFWVRWCLLYINDISAHTSSSIRLFTDDCVLYRVIIGVNDAVQLQKDLIQMCAWAKIWQMVFNARKCSVLTITEKASPLRSDYTIGGQQLEHVDHHTYLGVELAQDLSWNCHIDQTVSKAQRTLNLLGRNLTDCSRTTKELAYKARVRPTLEYASCTWDPYQVNHIRQLETAQCKAARFVTG